MDSGQEIPKHKIIMDSNMLAILFNPRKETILIIYSHKKSTSKIDFLKNN